MRDFEVTGRSAKWFVAVSAAVGAVFVPLRAPAAQGPAVVIRIATVAPENTSWMKTMHEIDTAVRKETAGAVGFKIFANGVMGDEPVVLRKIRSGQLQGGGFTGRGLGMIAPSLRVMEIPFLFGDYAAVDHVREKLDPKLESLVHDQGFTVLGWADVGFVYLFSRPQIATRKDLESAKMWVWEGDPLAQAFFKAVGVVPVPLPITDVVTSLQTHLVDCVYASPLACLGLQWFTRVSNYTDVPVTFATGAVVVSNDAFESIPAQHRETVQRICHDKFHELTLRTRKEDAEALDEIEKSGVHRVEMPADEVAYFRTIGAQVGSQQAGVLYSKELLEEVRAAASPAGAGSAAK